MIQILILNGLESRGVAISIIFNRIQANAHVGKRKIHAAIARYLILMPVTNIDTTYLRRCIDTLESMSEALQRSDSERNMREAYGDICIEKFELALEQSGKLLKKRLRPWFASNRQADRLTFRDTFRHAAKHGLIPADACERWLEYRDNRNHTENNTGQAFAESTLRLLPALVEDARALADVVEELNDD